MGRVSVARRRMAEGERRPAAIQSRVSGRLRGLANGKASEKESQPAEVVSGNSSGGKKGSAGKISGTEKWGKPKNEGA